MKKIDKTIAHIRELERRLGEVDNNLRYIKVVQALKKSMDNLYALLLLDTAMQRKYQSTYMVYFYNGGGFSRYDRVCNSLIEYKNGNFRYIKSDGVDVDFIADAKIEVTIGPGIAIQLFKKIALIEIMIDVGVGAAVEFTAHLFDAEGHELYSTKTSLTSEDADKMADDKALTSAEDILAFAESQGGTWKGYQKGMSVALKKGNCMEWKLYPILKIGIDGSSLVGKLAKSFKVTLTVQFLGENSDFGVIKGHIDYPNNITNMINSGRLTVFWKLLMIH